MCPFCPRAGRASSSGGGTWLSANTARSRAQVAHFFDGLELAEPGLVRITQWDSGPGLGPAGAAALWAGLARKPG